MPSRVVHTAELCPKPVSCVTTDGRGSAALVSVTGGKVVVPLRPETGCAGQAVTVETPLRPVGVEYCPEERVVRYEEACFYPNARPHPVTGDEDERLLGYLQVKTKHPDHCHWASTIIGVEDLASLTTDHFATIMPGPGGAGRGRITETSMHDIRVVPGERIQAEWHFWDGSHTRKLAAGATWFCVCCLTGGLVEAVLGEYDDPDVRYRVRCMGQSVACRPSDFRHYAPGDWVFLLLDSSKCSNCRRTKRCDAGCQKDKPTLDGKDLVILPLQITDKGRCAESYASGDLADLLATCIETGQIITVDKDNDDAEVEVASNGATFRTKAPIHYRCPCSDSIEGGSSAFSEDDVVILLNRKGKRTIVGFEDGLRGCYGHIALRREIDGKSITDADDVEVKLYVGDSLGPELIHTSKPGEDGLADIVYQPSLGAWALVAKPRIPREGCWLVVNVADKGLANKPEFNQAGVPVTIGKQFTTANAVREDHWLTSPGTCRGRFWLPQDRIFTGPREHYRLELGYLRIEATVIGEPPTPRYTLEDPSGYGGLEGDGREWRAYPVEYRYRVDVETSLTNLRYEAPTLPADFVLGRMFYKRRCYNRTYGVWPGITTEKSVPYDCGKCSSGVDMVTREAALDLDTSWIANPVVSGPYDGNIYSESIEFERKITCDFKRYFWSEEPRDQAEYDYAIDNTQHPVWLPFWWCLMLNLYEGAELRIDNPRIKVKLLWDFMQTHPDNLPVED